MRTWRADGWETARLTGTTVFSSLRIPSPSFSCSSCICGPCRTGPCTGWEAFGGFVFSTPWHFLEFVGSRQWERSRKGEPQEPARNERLFTQKAYGIVRHPLYLGISVVLAFQPVQTRHSLLSTAMVVLYLYVGTFFEERRMVRKFGEEYRKYQERVTRFLPLRWPPTG